MNYYFEDGQLVIQFEERDDRMDADGYPGYATRYARLPLDFAALLAMWLIEELPRYQKLHASKEQQEKQARIAALKEELARLEAGS